MDALGRTCARDDRSDCRNRSCLLFCWAGAWRRLCAAGLVSARAALRLSRNRRSRRGALVSRGFLDTHTGHRAGLAFHARDCRARCCRRVGDLTNYNLPWRNTSESRTSSCHLRDCWSTRRLPVRDQHYRWSAWCSSYGLWPSSGGWRAGKLRDRRRHQYAGRCHRNHDRRSP